MNYEHFLNRAVCATFRPLLAGSYLIVCTCDTGLCNAKSAQSPDSILNGSTVLPG